MDHIDHLIINVLVIITVTVKRVKFQAKKVEVEGVK